MSALIDQLKPRLAQLPRAIQWLLVAVVLIGGFKLWDWTIRPASERWAVKADNIERDLQTVRNRKDLVRDFNRRDHRGGLADTIRSTGPIEIPSTAAVGKDHLNRVVNSLLNEYRVSNDSFVIRTEGKLPKKALPTITKGTARVQTIRGNLDFEASASDATAIIAALETDPAIECLRSLSIAKAGGDRVKIRLVLEAWVLSGTKAESGEL